MMPMMMGVPPISSFLVVWVVMMVAMMFPSVAPTAIRWMNAIERTASGTRRALRIAAFIAGYLIAWTACGVIAFGALAGIDTLTHGLPSNARWITATLFAFAGIYQLTPLKRACLRHCRSPLVALHLYAGFSPRARDFRVGLHHGTFCVGCCWGLMAILVAVGVMNLLAMIMVSVMIFLEKRWRGGEVLAHVLGFTFLAFAAVVACTAVL
jgi:predicted metal-binding membrane protein